MKQFGRKVGFLTAFLIPILVVTGYYLGGYFNFLAAGFSFVVLPALDVYIGVDTSNVKAKEGRDTAEDGYYRFVTYVWTFVQLSFVCWGAYAIASGNLNVAEWVGFIMGFALVTGGVGITVAHELGHKHNTLEQFYARLLLMTVCYMHFLIAHNRGHHVAVGTPDDPATARMNESFYRFWLRSVFGGYMHAWKLDKVSGRTGNQMIWFAVTPIAFCLLLTFGLSMLLDRFTWEVPVFFFTQSVVAFTLLELVNYVEHYGIRRREVSPGKYERINPMHAWNASHLLSNFFLFQLQRHSDHHVFAYKRYQVLDHHDESPQLPYGYPTMIIIALWPALWFRLMNARLTEWEQTVHAEQMVNTIRR